MVPIATRARIYHRKPLTFCILPSHELFFLLRLPGCCTPVLVAIKRGWLHGDRETRRVRGHVGGAADDAGVFEMFVEMIDILDDAVLHRSRDAQIVDHRDVLDIFAKPDTT